jgi:hypothetical protein
MSYLDSTDRAALISGLRELADYLEETPKLPISASPVVFAFPPTDAWDAMRAEIDSAAAALGVVGQLTGGGHYVASRSFGLVEYRAVAIPAMLDDESE